MGPGVPHFVYTPESSICHGGHFYCSQALAATSYAILQTFVTARFLTNTTHCNAVQGLQQLMEYWHRITIKGSSSEKLYLVELQQAGSDQKEDGKEIRT